MKGKHRGCKEAVPYQHNVVSAAALTQSWGKPRAALAAHGGRTGTAVHCWWTSKESSYHNIKKAHEVPVVPVGLPGTLSWSQSFQPALDPSQIKGWFPLYQGLSVQKTSSRESSAPLWHGRTGSTAHGGLWKTTAESQVATHHQGCKQRYRMWHELVKRWEMFPLFVSWQDVNLQNVVETLSLFYVCVCACNCGVARWSVQLGGQTHHFPRDKLFGG